MPLKNPGPKPKPFRSRPYFASQGYWQVWHEGKNRTLGRWTETRVHIVDGWFEQKKVEIEQEQLAAASSAMTARDRDRLTLVNLIDLYLEYMADRVSHPDRRHAIKPNTYSSAQRTLGWVYARYGALTISEMGPDDFTAIYKAARKQYGDAQLRHIVSSVRSAFKWAGDNGHLTQVPAYGSWFRTGGPSPSKADKLFTAHQINVLLGAADDAMKAMILLGINGAYLAADCAELAIEDGDEHQRMRLDDDPPFIAFRRVKTGVARRGTLWPETVDALRAVIGTREKGLVFRTRKGYPLIHQVEHRDDDGDLIKTVRCDATSVAFRKLMVKTGLRPKQPKTGRRKNDPLKGVGLSALRTTFYTVAMSMPNLTRSDEMAVQWVMGWKMASNTQAMAGLAGAVTTKMADVYFRGSGEENTMIKRVTDHVHEWLFGGSDPP